MINPRKFNLKLKQIQILVRLEKKRDRIDVEIMRFSSFNPLICFPLLGEKRIV